MSLIFYFEIISNFRVSAMGAGGVPQVIHIPAGRL
jgi:hypothetical protein